MELSANEYQEIIALALAEDLGRGDATSDVLMLAGQHGSAT